MHSTRLMNTCAFVPSHLLLKEIDPYYQADSKVFFGITRGRCNGAWGICFLLSSRAQVWRQGQAGVLWSGVGLGLWSQWASSPRPQLSAPSPSCVYQSPSTGQAEVEHQLVMTVGVFKNTFWENGFQLGVECLWPRSCVGGMWSFYNNS